MAAADILLVFFFPSFDPQAAFLEAFEEEEGISQLKSSLAASAHAAAVAAIWDPCCCVVQYQ